MNIYDDFHPFESENYNFRLLEKEDAKDLFEVYSDKQALPYFNRDNCNGDIFYYDTMEKMNGTISFWIEAYKNRWFARLAIVEKKTGKVIGTTEICYRVSKDYFNDMGILRIDVGSINEKESILKEVIGKVVSESYSLLGVKCVFTKVPGYAVERKKAVEAISMTKSEEYLVGNDGFKYNEYYEKNILD